MTFGSRVLKAHPASLVLASFLLAILIGTALLMLPWATIQGSTPFIDALFTATSAVCVTGLIVVDTGSFYTIFGQTVILALIQIGGLGVMTISVYLFRWLGRSRNSCFLPNWSVKWLLNPEGVCSWVTSEVSVFIA